MYSQRARRTLRVAATAIAVMGVAIVSANAVESPPPQGPSPAMVRHPLHVQPFDKPQTAGVTLENPYAGDAQAAKFGAALFVSYNCMDCHGADGSGAMGPSLADGRWHFGGTPGEIFESIYQGRPEGMPAWGGKISDADIWRLVSYLRTLEPATPVSTENFKGKEIERTGH